MVRGREREVTEDGVRKGHVMTEAVRQRQRQRQKEAETEWKTRDLRKVGNFYEVGKSKG